MEIITTHFNGIKLNILNIDNRRFAGEKIGRKDKAGSDIREGDIVVDQNWFSSPEVIIYNEHGCAFSFEYDDMGTGSLSHGWGESQLSIPENEWLIVGSIYKPL